MDNNSGNKNHSIYRNENIITIVSNRFHECLEIVVPSLVLNYTTEKKDFGEKILDCYGIIGIINLINSTYLVVITEAELSFSLFKREIYKVKNVEFISLSADNLNGEVINDYYNHGPNKEENEENYLVYNDLKNIFSNGFYFSNKYDLANSLSSHNQILMSKKHEVGNVIINYDPITEGNRNFLANFKFISKLIPPNDKKNTRVFVSTCIYGNIESFSIERKVENKKDTKEKIQIIVISRRNLMNFSLIEYKRGLSKRGFVSNMVETEVIMVYNNTDIYSHVFISSYLPIFFKDCPYFTEANKNKTFSKFFKSLIEEYMLLALVGINDTENDGKYFEIFKNLILATKVHEKKALKYFCLDAQNRTIIDILKDSIENGSNILDVLGFSNNNNSLKFKKDFYQIGCFYFFGLNDDLLHNNLYHLTNKIISFIYKKVSQYGKKITKEEGYLEGLKTIFQKRKAELISQFNPNMELERKRRYQRILEIMFGDIIIDKDLKENYINLKEEFSETEEIKIFVGSWNVGGTNLNKYISIDLDSWLIPKNEDITPNIYIIGFQEVVELTAGNIVLNLEDREKILLGWEKCINASLEKIGRYKKLIAMNLVGINLYCYVLEKDFDNISNLTQKYIKTGFGGAGNKGSCCINFNYYSSSISIACSHLAAGLKKNKQRLKEISEIINQKISSFEKSEKINNILLVENESNTDNNNIYKFQANEINENINNFNSRPGLFKDSDIWFLFGDLNFRIDMEYEEFSSFITKGENWDKLVQYDQFKKNQNASIEFTEIIEEDPIKHPPSYKFMIGSDLYDYDSKDKNEEEMNYGVMSGKKRNPSWCDRIFYKKDTFVKKDGKKILNSLGYYDCAFNGYFRTSDHRPVLNIFNAIVFKYNDEKKNKMEKEVNFNNKLNIKSNYLKKKDFFN